VIVDPGIDVDMPEIGYALSSEEQAPQAEAVR
jgi:hypothetical protein